MRGGILDRARAFRPPLALAVLAYAVLALLVSPNSSSLRSTIVGDAGDPSLFMAAWRWQAHTLYLGDFWHSTFFYPHLWVAAYTEHVAPLMPFYTFAEWVTGSSIAAYNFVYLSLFVASASTALVLALKITRSWPAAFIAGLVFGFSPFKFGQVTHLHISAVFLMPVALLLLRRLIEEPRVRTGVWLGVVWAIQTLISYYVGFMLLLALGVYGLAALLIERDRRVVRAAVVSVAAVLLGLVLIAPLTWPYFTRVHQEIDQTRSVEEIAAYSTFPLDPLRPSDRARFVVAAPFGRNSAPETQIFLGIGAGLLAIAGLVLGPWRESLRWLAVGLAGYVMTLGPYQRGLPMPYRVFMLLPGFKGLRVPGRFAAVFFLAIAVLAAMGAAGLWRRGLAWRVAVAVLGIVIVAEYAVSLPVTPPLAGTAAEMPAHVQWLRGAPPGAVAEIPPQEGSTGAAVAQAYRQYVGTYDWHPRLNGYSGYAPRDYPDSVAAMRAFPQEVGALSALGVRYVVVHFDEIDAIRAVDPAAPSSAAVREAAAANPRLRKVFDSSSTAIYEIVA